MIRATFCTTLLAIALCLPAQAQNARVVIIIDDLGYKYDEGRRAIALPGAVSFAVLPGTPRARQLAESAHRAGKDVLLHLPLQAVSHEGPPEPGGIMLDMSRERLRETFASALESVPFVIGVNNHRGSLLTRHPGHMRWLMEEIRAREDLFFVDSFTTPRSVALQMAREAGISAVRRDVFLDDDTSPEAIAREFERMKRLAKQRGTVVAIGHPHRTTLALLERELPGLKQDGIELVPVSALFAKPGAVTPTLNAGVAIGR
ncbi:MAG: divergent polysaccharide deacetylase family protein [Woeseiaceae bacterium]|nr:divergent polysaccharide deacetylase family protein [Woeseiaceae bacterium]